MACFAGACLVVALAIRHESLLSSLSLMRVSLLAYRCVLAALGGTQVLAQTMDRQGSYKSLYLETLRYVQSLVAPSR